MGVPRTIAFADGENLVARYQALLAGGAKASKEVIHEKDFMVWHPSVSKWSMFDFIRFNYYATTTGDQDKIRQRRDLISHIDYEFHHVHDDDTPAGTAALVPKVFHKPSKGIKSRNVDLQISIDMLRAAHLSSVDALLSSVATATTSH